ncbi:exopolysaccharide biosynthesis polyprenyl glycosylphosphotransferase [Rhodopila sp.]|uniref:exopolysaccharide biosynthesis polyprenyl glycosylphosphotransferase n=1 Tax=Rhodopila sp. TaxID=2480087 RepID=UPI003D11BDDA
MPAMAEPEIAIGVVLGDPRLSALLGGQHRFAPRPRLATLTFALVGLDAAVTAGLAFLCYALFNPARQLDAASVILPIACLTACLSLSFFERGLYAAAEIVSHTVPWRKIVLAWLQAVAIGTLATFCLAVISGHGSLAPGFGQMDANQMGATLGGAWLPTFLVLGFAGLIAARLVRLRLHAGGKPLNRTVIIGEPEPIHDLLQRMTAGGRRNFDVIGIVDHAANGLGGSSLREHILGSPVIDDIDAMERMIRRDAVDTVLVAFSWSAAEQMRAVIQRISMAPIDVYIYPGLDGLDLPLRRADRAFDHLPLLMACTRPIGGWGAFIKRAEDIALSLALLAFISPVMLAIALAIKLTSKGPVLFRQRRLGYNNRLIEVLKFRSMFTHLADADAKQQALRGDKRVTAVGAWLRRTSLDEIPQLLNVLRGDMSLVGPRPHALATTAGGLALEEAVPVYPSRHRVKPGITGWAQVNGYRGALDSVEKIVHRVNHDLYYIENWSLALDLKILWRTVRLVFADDNAF